MAGEREGNVFLLVRLCPLWTDLICTTHMHKSFLQRTHWQATGHTLCVCVYVFTFPSV